LDREDIRTHVRTLADELTEAPLGLFTNTELNSFINIAMRAVYVDLIEHIPWYFRKTKEFSVAANTKTYSIASDIGVSDLFLIETLLNNTSGEKPTPLIYLEDPEDLWQYGNVGETGKPKVYYYESNTHLGFHKTPDSAYGYKMYYFKRIPELSTEDAVPELPDETHELIAFQVLMRWYIRDESSMGYSKLLARYETRIMDAAYQLSTSQGQTYRVRPSIKESR